MGRLRRMLLLTFAIASWPVVAADSVGLEWPVASSPPKKIVLGYAASFPKALYEAFFVSEWDITLHVFDKRLKALGGYDTEVNATGRSFTFRVPQEAVGKNIISGGGDKSMLPLTLYYRQGKVGVWEDEKGYQRWEQVSLILRSTHTGEVGRVWGNPLAGNTHIGTEAVSSPDGKLRCSRQNAPCLDRLYQESRTGPQYCGYSVLRAEPAVRSYARYESEPPPSPFETGNLFVRERPNGADGLIVFCNRTGLESYFCLAEKLFEGTLPLQIGFDKGKLCEADQITSAVTDWLRSHVVLETRPSTALTFE